MARVVAAGGGGADVLAHWNGLWTSTAPGVHQERLEGLGFNPGAPDAVLVRLLAHAGNVLHFLWRTDLPPTVVKAALENPRWEVRGLILEQPWHHAIELDQWARLLEGPTAELSHTLAILLQYADCGVVLPGDLIDRLVHDLRPGVRAVAAQLCGVSAAQMALLAADPDPRVRRAATPLAWSVLDAAARRALLDDSEPSVRAAALLCLHQDPHRPMPVEVLDEHPTLARAIAEQCALSPPLFRRLAERDRDRWQRICLAANPHLTDVQVAELAVDADPEVRLGVSTRAELTERQRAAIPLEITEHTMSHALRWVEALHDDAGEMRRLAGSVHPLIRRSVARAAHLPADVVARLAADPDRTVQLFLVESCEDATPQVLLSVAAWWGGSLSHPDRPRSHPNFPRTGLLRYADDPNPLLRRLALDDQDSDAALAERFAHDPDELLRARAATDPRLSTDTLQRLLDEPDLHTHAARNASLPVSRLIQLLRTPGSARSAAGNPRIPAAVMHRMIDEADTHEAAVPQ